MFIKAEGINSSFKLDFPLIFYFYKSNFLTLKKQKL